MRAFTSKELLFTGQLCGLAVAEGREVLDRKNFYKKDGLRNAMDSMNWFSSNMDL